MVSTLRSFSPQRVIAADESNVKVTLGQAKCAVVYPSLCLVASWENLLHCEVWFILWRVSRHAKVTWHFAIHVIDIPDQKGHLEILFLIERTVISVIARKDMVGHHASQGRKT